MNEVEGSSESREIGSSGLVSEWGLVPLKQSIFGPDVSGSSLRRRTYERIMRIARDLHLANDPFRKYLKSRWPLNDPNIVTVEYSQNDSFWLAVLPYINWGLGRPGAEQPDLELLETILSEAQSLTGKKEVPPVPQTITKPELTKFLKGATTSKAISHWGKENGFPAPLSTVGKTKHYVLSEVRNWIQNRYPQYLNRLPEEASDAG